MKRKLKNNKGITLISLTITVVILLLITGILVYNAKDSIYIKQYRNLSNDIQNNVVDLEELANTTNNNVNQNTESASTEIRKKCRRI